MDQFQVTPWTERILVIPLAKTNSRNFRPTRFSSDFEKCSENIVKRFFISFLFGISYFHLSDLQQFQLIFRKLWLSIPLSKPRIWNCLYCESETKASRMTIKLQHSHENLVCCRYVKQKLTFHWCAL